MFVHSCQPLRDAGTVVVFKGIDSDDPKHVVAFGVDHRMAQALIDDPDAEAVVEGWQILSSAFIRAITPSTPGIK